MRTLEQLVNDFNHASGQKANDIFKELYEKLSALERRYIHKYRLIEKEEVRSIFMEKLWECTMTYDKSTKFITFFMTSIRNAFYNVVRAAKAPKRVANLLKFEPLQHDGAPTTSMDEDLPDEQQEQAIRELELIWSFPEEWQGVVKDLIDGYSIRGVAKKRGLSAFHQNKLLPEVLKSYKHILKD